MPNNSNDPHEQRILHIATLTDDITKAAITAHPAYASTITNTTAPIYHALRAIRDLRQVLDILDPKG